MISRFATPESVTLTSGHAIQASETLTRTRNPYLNEHKLLAARVEESRRQVQVNLVIACGQVKRVTEIRTCAGLLLGGRNQELGSGKDRRACMPKFELFRQGPHA